MLPSAILFLLIALAIAGAGLKIVNSELRGVVQTSRRNRLASIGVAALFVCGLVALSVPFWCEFVDEESNAVVVAFDHRGRATATSSESVFCVGRCANAIAMAEVTGHVTPITDNPKARRLSYTVIAGVVDWPRFFKDTGVRPNLGHIPEARQNRKALEEAVAYQLYEFNDKHSRELAAFYNPLDQKQRNTLEGLLEATVNPALAENGIEVVHLVSFSVE